MDKIYMVAEQKRVITLCGSGRFEPWFHAWSEALGMSGHSVFTLVSFPSAYGGLKEWYSPKRKILLDELHARKIERSDAIVVLNVHDYVGESTQQEIAHAIEAGKEVYWLVQREASNRSAFDLLPTASSVRDAIYERVQAVVERLVAEQKPLIEPMKPKAE